MKIGISDTFTYKKLIMFTIPSILMMIITSIYGVVDGVFVSNFVGKGAFSSLNLIMPFIMMFGAFGFMLGTGGCALVAKSIGEGKKKEADEVFSMLIYILVIVGILFAIFGVSYIKPIAIMLGATPDMLNDCVTYGTILIIALPAFMLQTTFQTFVVVAGKPKMGMQLAIISGITNMVLDYVFIVQFKWGIGGAAFATSLSQLVGGVIPFIYFIRKNNSDLKLVKFKWNKSAFIKTCTNGSSEMMTSISFSLVNILYNFQLMKFLGPNGVSAYGVIMYISFIFSGIFMGYTIGCSPIISYNYGAKNNDQLKNLFKKSIILVSITSIIMTIIAELSAITLSSIFVGYDKQLLDMTVMAVRLFAISYLFSGLNIFASAFFTALNNGKVSAFISFLRTFVLQSIMIIVLPLILGIEGIWLAVVGAEILCLGVSVILFVVNNKYYEYY